MAYQEETTIATPDVLIDRVLTFATANGWTVERNGLVGSNRTATLRKVGVTDYIHIYNVDGEYVCMRISVGYDSGLPPEDQPNVSDECVTLLQAGAYPSAFLFASADMVWVVVGVALSGEYRHFTFGRLEKIGAYTGGTYVEGTYWPVDYYPGAIDFQKHMPFQANYTGQGVFGYLRADVAGDSRLNWFHPIGTYDSDTSCARSEAGAAYDNGGGTAAALVDRADKNAFSGRSVFHVLPVWVKRIGSETYYSPAGVVQDVRYCSLNKLEVEQEVTIGSDVWKVFPVIAKRPLGTSPDPGPGASGDYGYAIKKT